MIKEGDIDKIGPERLRGLQKILPVEDEVQCIYLSLFLKIKTLQFFSRHDQYLVKFAKYKINYFLQDVKNRQLFVSLSIMTK